MWEELILSYPGKRPPRAGPGYFLGEVTEKPALNADPNLWKTNEPEWANQWPLTEEK